MSKSKSGYRRVKWLFGKEIEVPDEWIKTNLNAVCRSIRDGTHTPPRRTSSGIPLLSAQNIMNNGINWKEHFSYISKYDFEQITKNNKISINDILITIVGTIGRVCVAQDNNEFTVQRSVAILKLRDSIVPQFLNYYMQSLWFIQIIQQKSSGVAQKGVYLNDLKQIKIFYPDSKIEQKKIASILSGVDALIESTQEVIAKTERLKKGLMQKLLTKGIEHTKFKKTNGLFRKEIKIPEEWSSCQLKDASMLSAGGTPSTFAKEFWNNGTIPWVSSSEVKNNRIIDSDKKITKLGLENSAAKLFPKGTVLIAITGFGMTRGRSAILEINASTNQSVVGIQSKREILDEEFLWYLLQNQYWVIRNFAQGSQQPGLNLDILEKFQICVPNNISEQQKIASILSGVDAYIQRNQEYKKKMELLKKGLMQKLLTGQIRVKVDH